MSFEPRTVSKGKPVAATLCRLAFALWIWAVMLVVRIHPAIAGLDHSGTFMFNYAHVHGMIFGRDVAFTYASTPQIAAMFG